jgi:hypothetical protein
MTFEKKSKDMTKEELRSEIRSLKGIIEGLKDIKAGRVYPYEFK